mmetsp:Transcript_8169/g.16959  ORF Transcript_8169/g.16959 Transcript_8169/m.16959 type:complete len:148 (-) Transcript_8169:473-916(-)
MATMRDATAPTSTQFTWRASTHRRNFTQKMSSVKTIQTLGSFSILRHKHTALANEINPGCAKISPAAINLPAEVSPTGNSDNDKLIPYTEDDDVDNAVRHKFSTDDPFVVKNTVNIFLIGLSANDINPGIHSIIKILWPTKIPPATK